MSHERVTPFPTDTEYLVFTVNKNLYGVPHHVVTSVIDMPAKQVAVPQSPEEMRCMIDYRGDNIPIIDLRVCFGYAEREQETEELLHNMAQRKQDHINWLTNLKDQVFNNKPITVQTNPHKCAFGLWYDKFKSDNINIRAYMERFDEPHKKIHHLAIEADAMIKAGHIEDAKDLITSAEGYLLQKLLSLFDGIEAAFRSYLLEYIVLVDSEGHQFGLAVDDINVFSTLDRVTYPASSSLGIKNHNIVQGSARYLNETEDMAEDVMLLDLSRIISRCNVDISEDMLM